MQQDIRESVRSVALFRELSDRELGEVVQVAKRVEYPAGATVASEGERPQELAATREAATIEAPFK